MLKKIVLAQLALWLVVFASFAQAAPKIEYWTTANGLRVYYVPAPELPMLDLRLVFDAGSARDGAKPGLAMLTK
jgi:Predicted Zn-dependent peptidases